MTALWHKQEIAVLEVVCFISGQLGWYRGNCSRPQVFSEDDFFIFTYKKGEQHDYYTGA